MKEKLENISEEYNYILRDTNKFLPNPRELYIISNNNKSPTRIGTSKKAIKYRLTKYQSESPYNLKISFLANGPDKIINKVEKDIHEACSFNRIIKSSYKSSKQGSWYELDAASCINIAKKILHKNNLSQFYYYYRNWPFNQIDSSPIGACRETTLLLHPTTRLTSENYSTETCFGKIFTVPNLPKKILRRKDNWSKDGYTALYSPLSVYRNPYDIRAYDESVLKFIKKNGFKNYFFSSEEKAKELFPKSAWFIGHGIKNTKKIIDLEDGYCSNNYSELFYEIQKQLIEQQKKITSVP